MAPSQTTEELLALHLEEAKAQTALLQLIARNQQEQNVKLLALIVGSGKQLDQLERQVGLLGKFLDTLKSQVIPPAEDIPASDAATSLTRDPAEDIPGTDADSVD